MALLDSTYDTESGIARFIRRFDMILSDGSTLVQEIPSQKHFVVIEQECGNYQGHLISEMTNSAIIWARKLDSRNKIICV